MSCAYILHARMIAMRFLLKHHFQYSPGPFLTYKLGENSPQSPLMPPPPTKSHPPPPTPRKSPFFLNLYKQPANNNK